MKTLLFLTSAVVASALSVQAQTSTVVYTEDFDSFTVTSSGSGAHELGGATPDVTYSQWFSSSNYVNDSGSTLNFTSDANANRTRGAGVWLDTTGWTNGTVTVTFDISGFVASTGPGSGSFIQAYTASGVDGTNAVGVDIHGSFNAGVVTSGTAPASISTLGGTTEITADGTALTHSFIYSGEPEIGLCFVHQSVNVEGTTAAFSLDNLTASIGPTPVTPITKPNIILFYVDDLGWQDTELNDLDTPCPYETPNLTALAAAGMNFSQAYSPAPTCAPSRGAIISGQHPAKTRFTHVTTNDTSADDSDELLTNTYIDNQLDPTILTTADALKANGYSTGHSGKWHVGLTAASYGFDVVNHARGVHRGMNPDRNAASAFGGADPTYPLSTEKYAPYSAEYPTGISYPYDELTESALQFIADEKDQPFFLQVWHWMVHYPIVTRNEDLLKYYCTKFGHSYPPAIDDDEWTTPGQQNPYFASMVTTVDWSLGRLVDYLTVTDDPRHPGKKLIETTYIVFTSDNGGAEVRGQEIISENEPLRGKKGYVTDGGIRVPMVVSGPEIAAGSEFHTIVNQLDYFPTFLSLTDTTITQAEKDELCGADLEPILHGTSSQIIEPSTMQEREYLFWHFPHTGTLGMYAALRSGDYKIHKSFKTGTYELYRLTNNGVRTDIEEAVDLAGDPAHAAKLAELTAMLEEALLSKDAEIPYLNPAYTGRAEDVATLCASSFESGTRQSELPIDGTGPKIVEASVIYLTPILDPGDNEVVTEQYMGGMRQPATLSADGYNVSAVIPASIDSYCYMLVDENGFMQYTAELDTVATPQLPAAVAHWPLDETSGTTATDTSGNGHNATVTGGYWSTDVGALYFDGGTDVASIPASAFTGIANEITIAFWAYGGATQPVNDVAFYAADSSDNLLLNIHLPWSNSKIFWDAGANDRVISGVASSDEIKGKWNHWVFTKDAVAGSMNIYLNGALFADEATGNTESMSGITQAWFGGSNSLGNANYEGLLDGVKLYDVALTAAQAQVLYCENRPLEGYQAWIDNYPGLSDTTFGGDPDQDGIATGLEYVLNGKPTEQDKVIFPELDETGENLIFKFTRRADAVSFTEQCFQYGSDLSSWTDLNITEPLASEVSLGPIIGGLQQVTVTFPSSLAAEGGLFGRLKVSN
ncbi:sulfatase-like hydrolase/transferase [Haloferula sp.]|uniref:sulfatase-like hydrolase/transferase n=1 Tax=Haloferula sp. TaxID=2497595 RepID=UPI00329E6569